MADAGSIKATVKIEYDGSGLEQAKSDLASLADMAGSFGSDGGIGDALAAMGEQAAEASKALVPFNEAVDGMAEPLTVGEAAVSELNDTLGEHQQALLDTGEAYKALQEPLGTTVQQLQAASAPMALIAEHAQTLSEQMSPVADSFVQVGAAMDQIALPQFADSLHEVSAAFDPRQFGLDTFAENMAVFQDAMSNPMPFSMVQGYLSDTGQTWDDFTSSIGADNVEMLRGVSENATATQKALGGVQESVQSTQDTIGGWMGANEGPNTFTEQFNAMGSAAENAGNSIEEAGKSSGSFLDQFYNSLGTQIFGGTDTAGIESPGIFAGFGDMMMGFDQFMRPLMYVQMGAQMIGQLGTAMYNTAGIAEGPAAHSIGTFTGAVDSLGTTMQSVGGSFSEAFGQQFTATIGAVNDALGTNQGGLNMMGSMLGGGLSFASNLLMGALGVPLALTGIGTPLGVGMIQAGMEGIANNFSQWMGWGTEFTGQQATPQMEYQAQVQQGISSIPTQVISDAATASVNAQKTLIEAVNPMNLQASASQAYAQQFAQTQLQRYEGQHPYNYTQELMQANAANDTQQEEYAYTHPATYGQQMGQEIQSGNWGGFFNTLGQDFFGGPNSPMEGLWNFSAGNILGDLFNQGNPVSSGSFFGGIGNAFGSVGNFLGGIGQDFMKFWNPTGDTLSQRGGISPISDAAIGAIPSGAGAQNLEHTFTATVHWQETNLEHTATAAAHWLEQGVIHAVTAVANWAEQGVEHAVTAVANWADQNVIHPVVAAAEWAEQNVQHAVTAVAQWAEQGVEHAVTAVAQWAEQGVEHAVTAVANWAEEGTQYAAKAVAQWSESGTVQNFVANALWEGQNLEHTFTATANWLLGSMPGFAEGTSSAPGGIAMIAEAGSPEVVGYNGQFSLFDQPSFVNLPAGAAVYPMQDLASSSSPRQLATGTVGDTTPITLPVIGGGSAPQSISVVVQLDSSMLIQALGMPMASSIRVGMGLRGY